MVKDLSFIFLCYTKKEEQYINYIKDILNPAPTEIDIEEGHVISVLWVVTAVKAFTKCTYFANIIWVSTIT